MPVSPRRNKVVPHGTLGDRRIEGAKSQPQDTGYGVSRANEGDPQVEQNMRFTPAAVLWVFSVLLPVTNSKALSATVALAAKAEPLAFRHRVQWQYVTVFSSPRTAYVTEPHKQLPL